MSAGGAPRVLRPVARPFDPDGGAVVEHAVQQRAGHGRVVPEELDPFGVGEVAGDDGACALVSVGEDLEEEARAVVLDGQVAARIPSGASSGIGIVF